MRNELTVDYFKCGQCGYFLKPYDGDAALEHIQKHYVERQNPPKK
jgi:hypothetical protein